MAHSSDSSGHVEADEDEEEDDCGAADFDEETGEDVGSYTTTEAERKKIVSLIRRARSEPVGSDGSVAAPSAVPAAGLGAQPASLHHVRAGRPRQKRSRRDSSDNDSVSAGADSPTFVVGAGGAAAPIPLHSRLTRASAAAFPGDDMGGWPRAPKGPRLELASAVLEMETDADVLTPTAAAPSSGSAQVLSSPASASHPSEHPFSATACPPHLHSEMWRTMHWKERRRALECPRPPSGGITTASEDTPNAGSASFAPTPSREKLPPSPSAPQARAVAPFLGSTERMGARSSAAAECASPLTAFGQGSRELETLGAQSSLHSAATSVGVGSTSSAAARASATAASAGSAKAAIADAGSNERVAWTGSVSTFVRSGVDDACCCSPADATLEQLRLEAADAQARYSRALDGLVRTARQKLAGAEAAAIEGKRTTTDAHRAAEDAVRQSAAADAAEVSAKDAAREAALRSEDAAVTAAAARATMADADLRREAVSASLSETRIAVDAAKQALALLLEQA